MSRSLALTTLRTASSVAPSLSSSPLITAASLRPTYVNGAWRRPAVSAMQVARARKAALMAGQPWTLTERTNKRKEKPVKFKGHKAERLAGAKSAAEAEAAAAPHQRCTPPCLPPLSSTSSAAVVQGCSDRAGHAGHAQAHRGVLQSYSPHPTARIAHRRCTALHCHPLHCTHRLSPHHHPRLLLSFPSSSAPVRCSAVCACTTRCSVGSSEPTRPRPKERKPRQPPLYPPPNRAPRSIRSNLTAAPSPSSNTLHRVPAEGGSKPAQYP